MFDKREAILVRVLNLLKTIDGPAIIDGVPSIFRNRGEVPTAKLPAIVMLDGREEIRLSASGKGGIKVATLFTLHPQVFVLLKPTEDVNNEGIGEELSRYRLLIMNVIRNDDELVAMLGSNGEVQYLGHETDMQTGSTMLGQMQMLFSLTYVLNPSDLK